MTAIDLDALVRDAKAKLEKPETVEVPLLIGDAAVTFEFTKLDPMAWRDLCALYPFRPGSARDRNLGFNIDAMPGGYPSTHVKQVDGEDRIELADGQWKAIFDVLESPDILVVSASMWGLHESEPQKRADAAKKALAKKKSGASRKR